MRTIVYLACHGERNCMRYTWRRQGSGAGALWHWHGREWLLEEGARALAMVKRPSEATFRLLPCSTCGFHDGLCSIAVRRCHNTGTFRGDAFARSGRGARCCEAETRRAPTNSCRSLPCTLAITAIEPVFVHSLPVFALFGQSAITSHRSSRIDDREDARRDSPQATGSRCF